MTAESKQLSIKLKKILEHQEIQKIKIQYNSNEVSQVGFLEDLIISVWYFSFPNVRVQKTSYRTLSSFLFALTSIISLPPNTIYQKS